MTYRVTEFAKGPAVGVQGSVVVGENVPLGDGEGGRGRREGRRGGRGRGRAGEGDEATRTRQEMLSGRGERRHMDNGEGKLRGMGEIGRSGMPKGEAEWEK